ncbi:MAG: hypothetical protein FWC32_14235 [Firmicutes bacterium]|nr:hypothetical protein [Bacillota bacterium]
MLKILLCLIALLTLAACGRNVNFPPAEYAPYPYEDPSAGLYPSTNEDYYPHLLPDVPMHNEYNVILTIDPETRTVQGISRINFTNRSGQPLETIVLRVFLNAFDKEVYPRPYTSDVEWRLHRPGEDRDRGHISIEYVFINNETLEYSINDTVLILSLKEPIEPDATVILSLQYSAHIPSFGHITGGNEYSMWFGMFLPVLPVYSKNGWHVEPFYPIGSPFFLETANYHVEVTTPLGYNVVGTGHKIEDICYDSGTKTTRFAANMVRDFAFAVLSSYYNSIGITTDTGVDIYFHYRTDLVSERASEILEFVRSSMEQLDYRIGMYPFGQLNIIETDTIHDSIAFSQLIFADKRHLRHGDLTDLSRSLVSQWFGSIVGTNRINEPWLDKGLIYFIEADITHSTPELLRQHMKNVRETITTHGNLLLTDGLWAFTDRESFSATHGYKAMLMLYQLQYLMGEENFRILINSYYQTFSFEIATVQDFIYMAEEIYGNCLEEFFYTWISSGTVPPLR